MPSPSKNKGSGFEREVAKYLTDTYGESFIRAPGSGAFTGGSNSHRRTVLHENQVRSFKGDIVPGESFPLMNVECKFYADFGFHQLFSGSAVLASWIKQVMDAADTSDVNIIFMKFNRKGRYVAVQASLPWDKSCSHTIYKDDTYGDWMIYSFENFFNLNTNNLKQYSGNTQV
jgi:hypothetical protein